MTGTHANPEITSGLLNFDIKLLPDRMRSIDDGPYTFFFTYLNHLSPWKQDTWIARDAINHRYDLLRFIRIGRRGARDRFDVVAPGGDDLRVRRWEFEWKCVDGGMGRNVGEKVKGTAYRVVRWRRYQSTYNI